MIGKIKGTISEIFNDEALIETASGLFYKVYITPDLMQKQSGDSIELYTHLNVKEDSLTLFGFRSHSLYRVFTMLVSVDGVGPKTAYTIISSSTSGDIRNAVSTSDVAFFQKIKGIGKKTAQRILVDLSGKFGKEFDLATLQQSPEDDDAVEALVALGFKKVEAQKILMEIDSALSIEERIQLALKKMSHKK